MIDSMSLCKTLMKIDLTINSFKIATIKIQTNNMCSNLTLKLYAVDK